MHIIAFLGNIRQAAAINLHLYIFDVRLLCAHYNAMQRITTRFKSIH